MRARPRPAQWKFRVGFVIGGTILALMGLGLTHTGIRWMAVRARYTPFPEMPTLIFTLWGRIFLLIGLLPWPKDPGPTKRRQKWRTHL